MGLLRTGGGWLLALPRGLAGALAAIWFAALHAVSWLPSAPSILPPSFAASVLHNWMHFPAYASLAAWIALAQRWDRGTDLPAPVLRRAFAGTVLAGLSDEAHQWFLRWRHADPFDLLTDSLAACGALWFLAGAAGGKPERVLLARGVGAAMLTLTSAALAALVARA